MLADQASIYILLLRKLRFTTGLLEHRLKTPVVFGKRVVHIGDDAAEVGASSKGRSPSRALNKFCRQACAVELAGDLQPVRPWVESKASPADIPSSWHGIRREKKDRLKHDTFGSSCVLTRFLCRKVFPYVFQMKALEAHLWRGCTTAFQ